MQVAPDKKDACRAGTHDGIPKEKLFYASMTLQQCFRITAILERPRSSGSSSRHPAPKLCATKAHRHTALRHGKKVDFLLSYVRRNQLNMRDKWENGERVFWKFYKQLFFNEIQTRSAVLNAGLFCGKLRAYRPYRSHPRQLSPYQSRNHNYLPSMHPAFG